MTSDPVVDEIKRYREEVAARFHYDLRAIVADVQRRQTADGHKVVRLAPRRPQVQTQHGKS